MALTTIWSAAVVALGIDAVVARRAGHTGDDRVHHLAGCRRTAAVKAGRACMAGGAVSGSGRNMPAGFGLSAARTLARIGAVMAGVAAAGADRRMVHRIGREAWRGIDVTIAALDSRHRDVRRRGHSGRGGAVVATRTVGVGRRVGKRGAGPRCCAGVTGRAFCRGCDVTRPLALRPRCPFAGVGAVVAGAASDGADRRVVHRVGRPRRRVGVAVAALECPGRNMRRRGQASCGGAVVARRAAAGDPGVIEGRSCPCCCAGVTGRAFCRGGDVTWSLALRA